MGAKNLPRLLRGQPGAALDHSWRKVMFVSRSAGKAIHATEKWHTIRASGEKYFEALSFGWA
jgi:hypothetical protein